MYSGSKTIRSSACRSATEGMERYDARPGRHDKTGEGRFQRLLSPMIDRVSISVRWICLRKARKTKKEDKKETGRERREGGGAEEGDRKQEKGSEHAAIVHSKFNSRQ